MKDDQKIQLSRSGRLIVSRYYTRDGDFLYRELEK